MSLRPLTPAQLLFAAPAGACYHHRQLPFMDTPMIGPMYAVCLEMHVILVQRSMCADVKLVAQLQVEAHQQCHGYNCTVQCKLGPNLR